MSQNISHRAQILINHQPPHLPLFLLTLWNALEIRHARDSHRFFRMGLEGKGDFKGCIECCSVSYCVYFVSVSEGRVAKGERGRERTDSKDLMRLTLKQGEHACYVLLLCLAKAISREDGGSNLLNSFQAAEFRFIGDFTDRIFGEESWHS